MSKITQSQKKISWLQIKIDQVVNSRWLLFFIGVVSLSVFWGRYQTPFFYLLTTFLVILSAASSIVLTGLERRMTSWKHYRRLVTIEEDRKNLNWAALPPYRAPQLNEGELDLITATDLHLIGPYSALHLMDSCISDFGQRTLVSHLLTDEPLQKIRARQKKIKELLPLCIFRMKFKLLGSIHSGNLINREGLLSSFGEQIFQKKFFSIFTLLVVVQFLNAGLIIGAALGVVKPYFVINTLVILLIYQLLKNQSDNAFDVGLKLQISLERLIPVFQMMERLPVKPEDALYEEHAAFSENPPTRLLKKINTVVALLSVSANPLLKLVLNILLPWDFGLLIVLESLKARHYPNLKLWLNSLGKFEALVSLADYSGNLGGKFPEFTHSEAAVYLEVTDLDHPLMGRDKRVSNSFVMRKDSPIGLITGSNMAGKSTFLRTVGLNMALAKAGTTVLANKFLLQNLTVMSLIKAQDFLEKEMSLFYFEVKRIKEILSKGREATTENPFLFLVDEIYRGTNNQERYQGAVAYLKAFSTVPQCCGLLTTHDINIAKDLLQTSAIRQYHFSEVFEGGALHYDYKINPGICETTNALRIMEKEGLPI